MTQCTNNRTMKKRIRKVISLCIFITVLIFSIATIFITAQMFKVLATFISDHFSYSISQTMNSEYFLKQIGINGLEDLNAESSSVTDWLNNLKSSEDLTHLQPILEKNISSKDNAEIKHIISENHGLSQSNFPFFNVKELVYVTIELNNKTLYSTLGSSNIAPSITIFSQDSQDKFKNILIQKVLNFYSDSGSTYQLYDSNGRIIGKVSTIINANFLLAIFISLALLILLAALLSLFIGNFMNKLLTIPITSPLKKLDEKIRAISSNDYGPDLEMQIVLKRPLKEIESLADATNIIVHKMKDYNNILEVQKAALENQNHELEAQNEELVESKKQIQEAQALLVQSENMASIGQLTAAITHEINTPLGAINSNVQISEMLMNSLLENQLVNTSEELNELLSQMKDANAISIMACQRVSEIIRSLKTFSKLDQAEFQEASVNEGIRSVLVLTSNLWKRKISIHEDYGSIPLARCFPGLLNQVFMNVIVNAIQAVKENGEIYIRTYSSENNIFASIRDTGGGIKEEYLSRIFESGFSTKGPGIGAGLGLSICKNIISKHNGDISVNSKPGIGTEFIISIPINNSI